MKASKRLVAVIWTALAGLIAGFAAVLLTYHSYRAGKIAIFTERNLPSTVEMAGDPSARRKVYVIGDSQAAHWPMECRADWLLYRSGFAGEATVNIAAAVTPILKRAKPNVVILISGGNDVAAATLLPASARAAEVRRSIRAFEQLIAASVEAGAEAVYVMRIEASARYRLLGRFVFGANIDSIRTEINAGIDAACHGRCRRVSLAQLLAVEPGEDMEAYLSDGVHLNGLAYARLVTSFDKIIGDDLR